MAGFDIDVDKWLQESDDGHPENQTSGGGGEYISLDDFAMQMQNFEPKGNSSQTPTTASSNHAYTQVTEGNRKVYKCNYCDNKADEEYKILLHCSQYHVDQDFHNTMTKMDSLENRLLKESLLEKSGPPNVDISKVLPGQTASWTNHDSDSDSDMHIICPRVDSVDGTRKSSEPVSKSTPHLKPSSQSSNIPQPIDIPPPSMQSTSAFKESSYQNQNFANQLNSQVQSSQKSNSNTGAASSSLPFSSNTEGQKSIPNTAVSSSSNETRSSMPAFQSTSSSSTSARPNSRNDRGNSAENTRTMSDRSSADRNVKNVLNQQTNSDSCDSLSMPILDLQLPTPPALIPDNSSETRSCSDDLEALALKRTTGARTIDMPDFGKKSVDPQIQKGVAGGMNLNQTPQPIPMPQNNAPPVATSSWGSGPTIQNNPGYFTNLLASCNDQGLVGQPMPALSQPSMNGSSLQALASMPSPLQPMASQISPGSGISLARSQSYSNPNLQSGQVPQMQSPPMYMDTNRPQMMPQNHTRMQIMSVGGQTTMRYTPPAQFQRQNSGPARLQNNPQMTGTSQPQMHANQIMMNQSQQMFGQQQNRQMVPQSAQNQMQQVPQMPQLHTSQPRLTNPQSRQQMAQQVPRHTQPQQGVQQINQHSSNMQSQQMMQQHALNQARMPNAPRAARPAILRNSRNQQVPLTPQSVQQNVRPAYSSALTLSSAGLRQVNSTQYQNVQVNVSAAQSQNLTKRQAHAGLTQALQNAATTQARAQAARFQGQSNVSGSTVRAPNPPNRNTQMQQFNIVRSSATTTGSQQNVLRCVFPGQPQKNSNPVIRQGIPNNILPPGNQEQFQNTVRQSAPAPSVVSAASSAARKNSQDGKLFIMKQIGEGYVLTPYFGTPAASTGTNASLPATKQISLGTLQNLKELKPRPELMAYLDGRSVPPAIKFRCKLCSATTSNPNMIRWHLYAYHLNSAPLPLRCKKCTEAFLTENIAVDHCLRKHNANSRDCLKFDDTILPLAQTYSIEMFKIFTEIVQESIQKPARAEPAKPKPTVASVRYECRICLTVETNCERMKKHMENSHNPFKVGLYQCWYCPEHRDNMKDIEEHVSKTHSTHPKQYAKDVRPGHKRGKITERLMEFAKKLEPDMSTLKVVTLSEPQPQKADKTEIIQCPLCSFIALQIFVLENHIKNDHLPFRPYLCHGKDYKAATVKDLKGHLTKSHADWLKEGGLHKRVSIDGEMSSCQERETKNYLDKSIVKGLEFKLKETPSQDDAQFDLQCIKCSFKTNNHRSLEVHIKLRHLSFTPYICRLCGICTVLKETVLNHIAKEHPAEPAADIMFTDQIAENNQEDESTNLMVQCICSNDDDEYVDDDGRTVTPDVPNRQGSVESDLASQLLEGTGILAGTESRSGQTQPVEVTGSLPAVTSNASATPAVSTSATAVTSTSSTIAKTSFARTAVTSTLTSITKAATASVPVNQPPIVFVTTPTSIASTSGSRVAVTSGTPGVTITSPNVLTSPTSCTPIVLTPTFPIGTSQSNTTSVNGIGAPPIQIQTNIPVSLTSPTSSIQVRPFQVLSSPLMFFPVAPGIQQVVQPGTQIIRPVAPTLQTAAQPIRGVRPILPVPTIPQPSLAPTPSLPQLIAPNPTPPFVVTTQTPISSTQTQSNSNKATGIRIKQEPGLAESDVENSNATAVTPLLTEGSDTQDSADVVQISSDSNDTQDTGTALVLPQTDRNNDRESSPESEKEKSSEEQNDKAASSSGNDEVVLSIPNPVDGSVSSMAKITSLFTGEQIQEAPAEPLKDKTDRPPPPLPDQGSDDKKEPEPDMSNLEKAYQCHMCEEIFVKMWTLRQHCIAVHFVEHWPFYCSRCNFRTSSHPVMKEHMKNEHNVTEAVKSDRKLQNLLQERLQDMWNRVKHILVPKASIPNADQDKSKKKSQAPVVSASISEIQKKLKVRNKKSKSRESSKERGGKSPIRSPPTVKISPAERRKTVEKPPTEEVEGVSSCFSCERYREGSPVEVKLPLVYITSVNAKECTMRCHCDYSSQNIAEFIFHIWSHTGLKLYHCGMCLEDGNEKKVVEAHCKTKHHEEVQLHRIRLFKSVVKLLQQHLEFVVGKLQEFSAKNAPTTLDKDERDLVDIKKLIYLCPFCDFKNVSVLNLIHHEKIVHPVRMMKVTLDFRASMDSGETERLFKASHPLESVGNAPSVLPAPESSKESEAPKAATDKENQGETNEVGKEHEKHIKMKLDLRKGKRKAQILSETSSDSDTSNISENSKKRKKGTQNADSLFMCHMCKFTCQKVDKLENHLLEYHTSIRPYRCGKCDKNYLFKDEVRQHIIRRHPNSTAKLIINKQLEIIMEKARKGLMKKATVKKVPPNKRIKLTDTDAESTSSVEIIRKGRKRKQKNDLMNDPKLKMKPVVILKDIAKSKKKRYRKIVEAHKKMKNKKARS